MLDREPRRSSVLAFILGRSWDNYKTGPSAPATRGDSYGADARCELFHRGDRGDDRKFRDLGTLLQYARLANVGLPAGVGGGLVVGFLVWFGFPLFGMITGGIFEGRSGKLVGLNVSHALVSFLAMGLVLGIWV